MSDNTVICPTCNGAGRVVVGPPLGTADGPQYGNCPTCGGKGRVPASAPTAAADDGCEIVEGEVSGVSFQPGRPDLLRLELVVGRDGAGRGEGP